MINIVQLIMEAGISYEFPSFEGKYAKFNYFPVKICPRLPLYPNLKQVFVLHGTNKEMVRDGWNWGFANKSDKTFFSNEKDVQKALKYKCNVVGCPAVKYVDMVVKFDMTRVYYDSQHKHGGGGVKSADNLQIKKVPNFAFEDVEKRSKPIKKLKTKSEEQTTKTKLKKKSYIDSSDEEEVQNTVFAPSLTSTPAPASGQQTVVDITSSDKAEESLVLKSSCTDSSLMEKFKSSNKSVNMMLEETVDFKLKIKLNEAHLNLLKDEKKMLSTTLLSQMKEIQKLKTDNLILKQSLDIGQDNIETLKSKNIQLRQQLHDTDNDEPILTLEDHIIFLENLIKEKVTGDCNSEEIYNLQKTLEICSAKKKVSQNIAETHDFDFHRQNISKNLLEAFDESTESRSSSFSEVNQANGVIKPTTSANIAGSKSSIITRDKDALGRPTSTIIGRKYHISRDNAASVRSTSAANVGSYSISRDRYALGQPASTITGSTSVISRDNDSLVPPPSPIAGSNSVINRDYPLGQPASTITGSNSNISRDNDALGRPTSTIIGSKCISRDNAASVRPTSAANVGSYYFSRDRYALGQPASTITGSTPGISRDNDSLVPPTSTITGSTSVISKDYHLGQPASTITRSNSNNSRDNDALDAHESTIAVSKSLICPPEDFDENENEIVATCISSKDGPRLRMSSDCISNGLLTVNEMVSNCDVGADSNVPAFLSSKYNVQSRDDESTVSNSTPKQTSNDCEEVLTAGSQVLEEDLSRISDNILDLNDTLVQSSTPNNDFNDALDEDYDDLDSSITFCDGNIKDVGISKKFEKSVKDSAKNKKKLPISFRVSDSFWEKCKVIEGSVPYGHNGKAVFKVHLEEQKKMADLEEINDGRNWTKKKIAVKEFEGCFNHSRFYQNCDGYLICPNLECSARKLFSKPSLNYVKTSEKASCTVKNRCSACTQEMEHMECIDTSVKDKHGQNPNSRRYLDFNFCHSTLLVK